MRMLFPLEFRVDSLANSAVMLPFHYPLMAGEMIYLPERIDSIENADTAHDYFFAVAAHLASRHEFGTFGLKLADIPGFEDRGETGAEAIDSFVASFEDQSLGGALMRLCESARIDAELCRRYRGLAPRVATLNRALVEKLSPEALSTTLIRSSLGLVSDEQHAAGGFAAQASAFFEPLEGCGRQRARQHAPGVRALSLDRGVDRGRAPRRRRRSARWRGSHAQRSDQRCKGVGRRVRRAGGRKARARAASRTRTSTCRSPENPAKAARAARYRPRNSRN